LKNKPIAINANNASLIERGSFVGVSTQSFTHNPNDSS